MHPDSTGLARINTLLAPMPFATPIPASTTRPLVQPSATSNHTTTHKDKPNQSRTAAAPYSLANYTCTHTAGTAAASHKPHPHPQRRTAKCTLLACVPLTNLAAEREEEREGVADVRKHAGTGIKLGSAPVQNYEPQPTWGAEENEAPSGGLSAGTWCGVLAAAVLVAWML